MHLHAFYHLQQFKTPGKSNKCGEPFLGTKGVQYIALNIQPCQMERPNHQICPQAQSVAKSRTYIPTSALFKETFVLQNVICSKANE